jgi:hypothetical protein
MYRPEEWAKRINSGREYGTNLFQLVSKYGIMEAVRKTCAIAETALTERSQASPDG